MGLLKCLPVLLLVVHFVSAWNYGGGGGGWHEKIKSQIIVKHIPKHVPIYKPVPYPKPVVVPKPVGYLKPLAIAKPFKVPHVIPVIKHFQKPFPVIKGVPFHFPIPLPKLVKLPFQIKVPKPYVVHVPKPYAVAKKYPVAVPVHIPKPYYVPVIRPVPVGVPHKIPKIIPIVKEVPEYVKKPVPVYIEEKPYNHKGTPFVGHKGSSFPSGIRGSYKGTPFPSGGDHKGSPFQGGGNKGNPYISAGKGGGGGYQGSNVHPTSAASFLAAHAGKLGSQGSGDYGNLMAAYSHPGQTSFQGFGGGIHGGLQNQGFGGYHGFGSMNEAYGSYAGHGGIASYGMGGGYDLHGLASVGAHENNGLYGRGAETNKVNDEESAAEEHGSYDSVRAAGGHLTAGNDEFDKRPNEGKEPYPPKENENIESGHETPAYVGVSVTSYDDHAGRGGGGYPDNYNSQEGYVQNLGENSNQDSAHGYQNYAENAQYHTQSNDANYAHQGNSENYAQIPQIALYQIQNGEATRLNYPGANLQVYNLGYQDQNGYQQVEGEYANNQLGSGNYEPQAYQQQGNTDTNNQGGYQQPNAYVYQGQGGYQGETHQGNQDYSSHPNQENGDYSQQDGSYGNGNQESYKSQTDSYPSQDTYNNQGVSGDAYHSQASYQVSPNTGTYHSEGSYSSQDVAPGLQQYGLRAAYPVQPGVENNPVHQGATGTVYVRAYDNQGDSQAAYVNHNQDNYHTQDSQPQKSYAAYSTKTSTQQEAPSQATSASGRSTSEAVLGGSSGYSTPEGGDTKGGSWQGVPVK